MGRLDDIITRNQRPIGLRASASMMWRGVVILIILGLMLFTDWGIPRPDPAPRRAAPARGADPAGRRLDGVPILRPAGPAAGSAGAGSAGSGTGSAGASAP